MKLRLRKVWFRIHLYLGLVAGLLFALLGLTGGAIVFDHTLDEWLNPGLVLATRAGTPRTLAEIAASAKAACPDLAGPHYLITPRTPASAYLATFSDRGTPATRFFEVYVDPTTARVLGRREFGTSLIGWIYKLHYSLHLGVTGATAVGVAGFGLMLSVASGLYLWWPIFRKGGIRPAFRIRRATLDYDLHKTVGVASALVLFVISFTGAYMVFPGLFKAAVGVVAAETPYPANLKATPMPGVAPLSLDLAAAIASGAFPDAKLKGLQPPAGPGGVFIATLQGPGEVRRSWGACQVWIDPYRGDILAVRDWQRRNAADTFFAWQFPLHNGEAFGLIGRWLVLSAGLTPALLYVTGLRIWWRKRHSRKRQRASTPRKGRQPTPAVSIMS